jgi:uncharacterized OsmC-like protein
VNEKPPVILEQQQDYRFAIRFGEGKPTLIADESPPLGAGVGPTPGQLLMAAVANCMADSLLFALRKFKQAPEPIRAEASADLGRNAEGHLRVLAIHLTLQLGVPAAGLMHLDRVLDQFENFCTVGQSVAQGIPVLVTVTDSTGTVLKAPATV